MEKLNLETKNLAKDKFIKLAELFPNAITETILGQDEEGNDIIDRAIDADVLRQEIGEHVIEGREERYEFTWPDKRKSMLLANAPINKTLRPIREDSLNFDETENLYIEGDNLDVLKLLRETYLGKVKMIYIDPPYNTGNDFVYEDDFAQKMEDYKEVSGDFDEEGNRLFKNTDSNGRFHTDWLNMMYPRLKLARDLLSDDGIIFISIDDHEVSNLKKMCDEVFGESKFVEIFCWQKTSTPPNLSYKTKKSVEYILAYEKQNCGKLEGLIKYSKSTNGLMNQSNNVGILQFPHEYTETSMQDQKFKSGKYGTKSYDIELMNDIEIKDGKFTTDVILKGKFKWNQNYLNEQVKNGTKLYIKTKAFSPSYDKEEYDPEKPWNIIDKSFGVGTNVNASDELDNLFTINFSENLYPKPSSLISYLISMLDMKDSIILDFFSGSATTAHAAMELNAKDNGNRKYIMVQLPEKTDNDKFETICEIGKERIRRAGKKIKEDYPDSKFDDGFRVLRVDSSNMKDVYYKPEVYSQSFLDKMESNIKEDRNEEDLLFQVMLSLGIDLSSKIEKEKISDNKVLIVEDGFLISCFDEEISEGTVESIAKKQPYYAVFSEGKMSDSTLANFEQIFDTYSPTTIRKVI